MYRLKDIEIINQNIDKIKESASVEYKTNYEPNLDEISNIYSTIINYIKENELLVYGGFAQNMLIKVKNPKDSFYKEIKDAYYNWPEVADMEIYSPTPIEDAIKLTEFLFKKNFKYVESSEGINDGTFKIFINFLGYVDISYMPYNIYNNLQIVKLNGFKFVHPYFMLCDTFRILTDPLTSYWRLDKSINRWQKILKYYPIDITNNNVKIKLSGDVDVLHFIRHKIIHNSKLIVVGFYAYNYYVKKYNNDNVLEKYPYYEVISTNIDEDHTKILNILNKEYKNKITIKKFCYFFDFLDKRTEYYYNNSLVLRLFGNNDRCTVYNYSEKKLTYFGTFNLVMMYLFFMYNYYYINKDSNNSKLYKTLIGKLYTVRNKYLDKHNITVIDESPFKDFSFKCIGNHLDPKRHSFLEKTKKKKMGKKIVWRYTPTGKEIVIPKVIFDNCSGNEIRK
jgi:hypothetical protein